MRIRRTAAVGCVVAGLALAVLAAVGRDEFAADRRPGALETSVAQRMVRLSIPPGRRSAVNPFAGQDRWHDGHEHFAEHCAVCHGDDGRGASAIGPHMYPPAPDLASPAIQQFSDGELFSIIQHGVSWTGMPAFGSTHSDEETWALVTFVRRVPTLKPSDLPSHGQSAAQTDGHTTTISIDGTQFQPAAVTVSLGDTVVWVNKDPFPHNVTSHAGGFHSGDLSPEQSWRFQATTRGTFHYVCTLHPTMAAVVRVQ